MMSQTGKIWETILLTPLKTLTLIYLSVILFYLDSIYIGEDVGWVKVNSDMTGYYVVHYADGGWDVLTQLLRENHTALSYKDRTHLIHNAFQLVT